jgi:hypothetical protein
MKIMKHPSEFENFTKLVDQVLSVPHAVIQKRVEAHRERAQQNPSKRGPKRKAKSSASARASSSGKKRAA